MKSNIAILDENTILERIQAIESLDSSEDIWNIPNKRICLSCGELQTVELEKNKCQWCLKKAVTDYQTIMFDTLSGKGIRE